jgi:hypothetical protein
MPRPDVSAQCIGQFRLDGTETLIAWIRQSDRIRLSSCNRGSLRRPLAPNRSLTTLASLTWHSSSRLFNWLCRRTLSRVSWYLVRVSVGQQRGFASGTKLKIQSPENSRLTIRWASRKSVFRPRVHGSIALVPSARLHYPPEPTTLASHTAPSIPWRSCTACSCSHADTARSSLTVVPNHRDSNSSLVSLAFAITTASIFLGTSIPAVYCFHLFLRRGAENARKTYTHPHAASGAGARRAFRSNTTTASTHPV